MRGEVITSMGQGSTMHQERRTGLLHAWELIEKASWSCYGVCEGESHTWALLLKTDT